MSAPSAFEAKLDLTRNLARVRYAGDFKGPAMEDAARQIETLLPQLRPPFTVFADFSQVESMDIDCVRPLTRIMDLCRKAGTETIVRILPPPERDIGIKLLGIVHYHGEVRTVTVESMEEAERVLPKARA